LEEGSLSDPVRAQQAAPFLFLFDQRMCRACCKIFSNILNGSLVLLAARRDMLATELDLPSRAEAIQLATGHLSEDV
jgi:hypothetical protein